DRTVDFGAVPDAVVGQPRVSLNASGCAAALGARELRRGARAGGAGSLCAFAFATPTARRGTAGDRAHREARAVRARGARQASAPARSQLTDVGAGLPPIVGCGRDDRGRLCLDARARAGGQQEDRNGEAPGRHALSVARDLRTIQLSSPLYDIAVR